MIFTESQPQYSVLDLGFDKMLVKGLSIETTPESINVFTSGLTPRTLLSGEIISVLEQQAGVVFSGKTAFDNTVAGYRLGIDQSDNVVKFYIGNTTEFINWDGSTLTITGGISVSSINIGGSDATSMHVDTNGNMWLGAATLGLAPFQVSSAGALIASNAEINGTITSSSGTIGGWVLSSVSLTAGSGSTSVGLDVGGGNPVFYAGSATPGSAPFRVTMAGVLTATSGTIGGWTLGATTLTGGSVTLDSAGIITGGIIQTSSATNVNRIKIVGADNQIQFFSSANTEVAQLMTFYNGDDEGCSIVATGASLNTYYTTSSGMSSIDIGASSAYVSAAGKSNLGNAQLGVTQDANNNAYLAVSWSGNNMATAVIVPYKIVAGTPSDLPWQGNFLPSASNTYDLGSSIQWKNLYIDGTAYLDTISVGVVIISEGGTVDIGSTSQNFRDAHLSNVALVDGITAPGTVSGRAQIYVDTADGDLKVKFGDGTVKTIATDT